MCTNKIQIKNPATQRTMFVNCGKCPACQQEKALKRSRLIKMHTTSKSDCLCIFVTLTYTNHFVPYVTRDDLVRAFKDSDYKVPIYRDAIIKYRYNRSDGRRLYQPVVDIQQVTITEIKIKTDKYDISSVNLMQPLRCQSDPNKFGVTCYIDFQNFKKRLQQNLKRHYNIDEKLSYYVLSEHGETYYRPHYHVLFWVRPEKIPQFYSAIRESWPYCDWHSIGQRNAIQVARNAAGYVSSYVNSGTDVPPLLQAPSFRNRHVTSQDFLRSVPTFQFPAIQKKVADGTLTYNAEFMVQGQPIVRDVPYPSRIIYRLFPRIKGYSQCIRSGLSSMLRTCLSACYSRKNAALINFANAELGCYSLRRAIERLQDIMDVSLKSVYITLINAYHRLKEFSGTFFDYLILYERVMTLRQQSLLATQYKSINQCLTLQDHLEHYDNMPLFLHRYCGHSHLPLSHTRHVESLNLMQYLDGNQNVQCALHPNQFQANISRTAYLNSVYNSMKKKRKINSHLYYT